MLSSGAIAELIILLAGYWLVGLVVRQQALHRLIRSVLPSTSAAAVRMFWIVSLATLSVTWSWEGLAEQAALRIVATTLAVMMAWKSATRDIDPVFPESHAILRLVLVIAAGCVWLSPAFVLIVISLLTKPFDAWEHHGTMPMRFLQAIFAWTLLSSLNHILNLSAATSLTLFDSSAVVFHLLLTIQCSHYLITALAKGWLGPKWYSWITDNRMHHLAASAYSWGWAAFIPWKYWLRFIRVLRIFERPMQLFAFAVELLAPLAFLSPQLFLGFSVAWTAFHFGVFVVSGLLFWEWMVTNVTLAVAVWMLPSSVHDQLFGPGSLLVAAVVMVAFPLRHKLWKPMPLGWWDTPLTQRIHWTVEGTSGTTYGLYNDFMCPNERLYGKVHGCFMAPVPAFTYHLGEVWKHDLRDAIREAGPDADRLDAVRERFGVTALDEQLALNHVNYLRKFFHALNSGQRKQVLPRALRWLKLPGGQIFYWGELPRYRGQEPVSRVTLTYTERYFDGEQLQTIRRDVIREITIDADAQNCDCVPEPTPKQIDDLLLRHANGKIIDLPDFGSGFVRGDDGVGRGSRA